MKFSLIAPPYYSPLVKEQAFNLVLAQYYLRQPKYAAMINRARDRHAFIMLDNGAAEGKQVPFYSLMEAANDMDADEVVLPDVIKDCDATIEAHLNKDVLRSIPPKHRAICPQGSTWDEWTNCLHYLGTVMEYQFATICIPKHLETLEGGRGYAMEVLMRHQLHLSHHIHWLGFSENPILEARNACAWRHVRSLDSGAPIAWAQATKKMKELPRASLQWNTFKGFTLAQENHWTLLNVIHHGDANAIKS